MEDFVNVDKSYNLERFSQFWDLIDDFRTDDPTTAAMSQSNFHRIGDILNLLFKLMLVVGLPTNIILLSTSDQMDL